MVTILTEGCEQVSVVTHPARMVTFFFCLVTKLFAEAQVDLCLDLWLSVPAARGQRDRLDGDGLLPGDCAKLAVFNIRCLPKMPGFWYNKNGHQTDSSFFCERSRSNESDFQRTGQDCRL